MRISLLSNSLLVFPTIDFLAGERLLAGLAAPESNTLLCEHFSRLADEAGVPFTTVRKACLQADLSAWIATTKTDCVVVQTFPYRIPEACLEAAPRGFFNIHPGPLPSYRGPDPVFWQLAAGETEVILTLHEMDKHFDTGPVLARHSVSLNPADTYGYTQSQLALAAPELLKTLAGHLENANPPPLSIQPQEGAAYHAKPSIDQLIIDWDKNSSEQLHQLVRACNPNQNGAITFFRGVMARLLEVLPMSPEIIPSLPPGTIIAADDNRGLQILCNDHQALRINVIHVDEGYYSGAQFCEVFEVSLGEKFSRPSFLS